MGQSAGEARLGGALAGALQEADLQSVPLRSLPALHAAALLLLFSEHQTLPVPQLTPSKSLSLLSVQLTLADPSSQDLPKYMKEKKMTATRTMETQMAGLTQELEESEMTITSSASEPSSAPRQVPSRQMTVCSTI